jgi:hypothetical protein
LLGLENDRSFIESDSFNKLFFKRTLYARIRLAESDFRKMLNAKYISEISEDNEFIKSMLDFQLSDKNIENIFRRISIEDINKGLFEFNVSLKDNSLRKHNFKHLKNLKAFFVSIICNKKKNKNMDIYQVLD